ncbi:phosphocholine cytidylyltransferase family protein [Rhizobium terrae]|uniref:phosphocholine cytidylyltransferase family protein n=1 Tax=Rhizobium terrae TaxID=2171756 RepID=UPI0013C30159|nr:NTP transferase domain-containing protein [Rhizobium terrae]
MITHAIIAAAGLGTRLRPYTANKPKGLVEVAGSPLLPRLARQLEQAGIEDMTTVIGYRGEMLAAALSGERWRMSMTLVSSMDFETSNNISSIAAAPVPDGPVLIADCDVLLSRFPSEWLQKDGADLTIPTRPLQDGEAGTVVRALPGARWNMTVLRRSQDARVDDRKSISLYLLKSPALVAEFFSAVRIAFASGQTSLYYEDVLSEIVAQDRYKVNVVNIEDLEIDAFEIDTVQDLQAAEMTLSARAWSVHPKHSAIRS